MVSNMTRLPQSDQSDANVEAKLMAWRRSQPFDVNIRFIADTFCSQSLVLDIFFSSHAVFIIKGYSTPTCHSNILTKLQNLIAPIT
jgi:hypothetical protein